MLLVPICALVLLAVSVYLISRASDNVAAISDNTFGIATNVDEASDNAVSLATDMTPQTIDGQLYMAFPADSVLQVIDNRDFLTAKRDALYDEWEDLRVERDRLTRDTTITISLSMFFVVASFMLAFFLPASKPADASAVEGDEGAEDTED